MYTLCQQKKMYPLKQSFMNNNVYLYTRVHTHMRTRARACVHTARAGAVGSPGAQAGEEGPPAAGSPPRRAEDTLPAALRPRGDSRARGGREPRRPGRGYAPPFAGKKERQRALRPRMPASYKRKRYPPTISSIKRRYQMDTFGVEIKGLQKILGGGLYQ